jgi:hypothetical protein
VQEHLVVCLSTLRVLILLLNDLSHTHKAPPSSTLGIQAGMDLTKRTRNLPSATYTYMTAIGDTSILP